MKIKIINLDRIQIRERKEKNHDGTQKQTILKTDTRKIIQKIVTAG